MFVAGSPNQPCGQYTLIAVSAKEVAVSVDMPGDPAKMS